MKLIRNLLERFTIALIAVAVSVAFYFIGRFTVPASILLGVCFTIVALWAYGVWKLVAFEAYEITVYVHFDALRDDLGLTKTGTPPVAGELPYDVFEFTAINAMLFAHYRRYTLKAATELNLIDRYAHSDSEYRSVLAFTAQIPCTFKLVQFDNSENRNPHPRFFFRPSRDGYQFGIQVVPKWWSEHSKQLSAQLRDLPVSYNDEVVLASLPYGYIPDHMRRWDKPVSLLYPFDLRQRQWKSKLAKRGWDIDDNCPADLSHRYLSVTFYTI